MMSKPWYMRFLVAVANVHAALRVARLEGICRRFPRAAVQAPERARQLEDNPPPIDTQRLDNDPGHESVALILSALLGAPYRLAPLPFHWRHSIHQCAGLRWLCVALHARRCISRSSCGQESV